MLRSLFRFLFSAIFWISAFVGICVISLAFLGYYWGYEDVLSTEKPIEKDSVLVVNMDGAYTDHVDIGDLESLFMGRNGSLYTLTRVISDAALNEKVKGLVLHLDHPSMGMAQVQELRDALLIFKKTGKPSWCYTDSFGEGGSGTGLYYLATGCSQIWMQPIGSLSLLGLNLESYFAKGALDKLDVKPEIGQRKEFKTAVEAYTRGQMSEENRASLQAVADSILEQIVDGVAKERNLTHERVRFLIEEGPYLTEDVNTTKLIDRIDYRQNLFPQIKEKLGEDIDLVGVKRYVHSLPHKANGEKIALIFGTGTIQLDAGDEVWGGEGIGSRVTYNALQEALYDDEVKAIVFRIDSLGGTPTASETIYSMMNHVKKEGKPIIVSMGDAAASGGYWVSLGGTKIVAQPSTLTGSIGVFGGKFVLKGFFDLLGITWDNVATSENATMWDFTKPFTPAQWIKLNAWLDNIYENFTLRVAKDRKLTPLQVEKVARGRVWTGEQALALGLIDALGGIQTAVQLARTEAKLAPDVPVEVYPPRKSFFENVFDFIEDEEDPAFIEAGILSSFVRPFQKLNKILSHIMALEQPLYAPHGRVK